MRSRAVVALIVVVLLVAGVIAAVVLLGGSKGVTLPDEVDGLPARDSEAAIPDSNDDRDEILDRQREARERVAERYADAYDGAEADVRSYGDLTDDDGAVYTVLALEVDAGPLIPEAVLDDPEYVGYAVPMTEVVAEGDADCLLRRGQPPVADSEYDDEDVAPDLVLCQRTSGSLTVRVTASNDPTVEDTAEFLDAVWAEMD